MDQLCSQTENPASGFRHYPLSALWFSFHSCRRANFMCHSFLFSLHLNFYFLPPIKDLHYLCVQASSSQQPSLSHNQTYYKVGLKCITEARCTFQSFIYYLFIIPTCGLTLFPFFFCAAPHSSCLGGSDSCLGFR